MSGDDFGVEESELIGAIYEAALDPTHWRQVLLHLCAITDAKDCNLIFHDMLNRQRNDILAPSFTTDMRDEYLSLYIDADMKWSRPLSGGMDGSGLFCVSQSQEILGTARDEVQDSALRSYYGTTLQYADQAGCFLLHTNYSTSVLAVNRPLSAPVFEPEILQLLRRLNPHLQRSIRIHHQLTSARDNYRKLHETLEKTAAGLLLLNADGCILFANREGARILEQHPVFVIGSGGRLQTASSKDNLRLQKLIDNANTAREKIDILQPNEISMALHHAQRTHPIKISVLPLKDSGLDTSLSYESATVVVFLTDPERRWTISNDYLHHAYTLTAAECSVSQALIDGAKPRAIAEQRGTSEETTRWQIKEILQKTGTHSQVELTRLLLNLNVDFGKPVA